MNNEMYLRRRRKIYVPEGDQHLPAHLLIALGDNVKGLGFVPTEILLERLTTLSVAQIGPVHDELLLNLMNMVGAHRQYKPMYPNFPRQVEEMPEARLYANAIVHYLTNLRLVYKKEDRPVLDEKVKLYPVDLGTVEEFEQIFTLLVSGKRSLSAQDQADVAWFVRTYGDDIGRLLPAEIPARETLAFTGALLLRHTTIAHDFLQERAKTATDVLRLAVALSDGDVSLAANTKFKAISRAQRRVLLSLLEAAPNLAEDMRRWEKRWIRLGERLHPGEHVRRFPRVNEAFNVLRNQRTLETYNHYIEKALEKRDVPTALALASTRPGDFARRLDHLLRLENSNSAEVLKRFEDKATSVSTPVLLQLRAHFAYRTERSPVRVFFPKGLVAKVWGMANNLPLLDPQVSEAVVASIDRVLTTRFASLPPLGRCYLAPELANFPIPSGQRSASKALRTLPRGSRLDLPDANVIRFFLWWTNGRSRTDIDLSVALYDEAYRFISVISYYNLKGWGAVHSGDIVDAPNGAAEFIDLDREKLIKGEVRYVVLSVNAFTVQPFCELPECFAGWMAREKAGSGEIFEARTVQNRADLAADATIALPLMVDLCLNEVIWTDLALTRHVGFNNVDTNLSGVSLMLRAMTNLRLTTLHDLFELHVQARGTQVSSPEEAETVFSVDTGITPFDLDLISAQYL